MPTLATFLMEQHIGHRTFYENVRRFIEPLPEIEARWVEVNYFEPGGVWERLTFLPQHWRGTARGRAQSRHALTFPTDVVICNTQVPGALAGRRLHQHPYILCTDITPRQYDQMARHYHHRPDKGGPLAAYKHWVNRNLFQNAARVLPWSTWTRHSLLQEYGVALDKIEVLPPGVDTERWRPRLHTPSPLLNILFVGRDLSRKGGHMLIQAFQALPPGLASLHLVTRTPFPSTENIHVYADLNPNDGVLLSLYQSCDLFVLPTEAEAFGIAAIEALAVGLPVITTPVGGLTDVVAEGENGYLLQPGDGQGLVQAMTRLATDMALRQRLGQAARLRAENRFDARKNAARLATLIRELGEKHEA
ncbi:MAG: glycosyltransferase family 4 protein [Candidatus Promineifilaceae bacterium]